ncbi:MAG: transporter substrate-binding domain-containing protein [Oscillospiraceae bacterium]
MKKLKKALAASLGVLMLLLAGCSSAASSAPATSSTPASSALASSAASGLGAITGENIDAIKAAGVLKVGVKEDVPKFGLKDTATGEFEGLEIELAKAIAESLGVEVAFTPVTAKTRGPLLETGELDLVIATFTITEERKETYNFSTPYYEDAVRLMVKKDSGFTALADMDGATIGVAQAATSMEAIQAAADEAGVSITFSEFATYPEIKAALDSGRVDCFSVDGSILLGYVDDTTVILDDKFSPQEYGVASALSKKDLAEYVDAYVVAGLADGSIAAFISDAGL